MTDEERARLWDAVLNCRLCIFPPGRGEGQLWLARTVGGGHDSRRLIGNGRTPEEAVQRAVASGTELE